MNTVTLIQYFFPAAIAVIMFGLGLTLSVADFVRVLKFPKAVVVGLFCQILFLPIVCFALIRVFPMDLELALGFMLLSATPGGVTANLFSHVFKGDVALNITLTAVSSVVCAFTLPLIVSLSFASLGGEGHVPFDFSKTAQIFAVILIPVFGGLLVNKKFPKFAVKAAGPSKFVSLIFLFLLVVLAISKEYSILAKYIGQIGFVAIAFNIISLVSGYFIGRQLKLENSQSIAIAMEVGVHNTGLSAAIATSPLLLNSMVMAIPSAVYTIIMYFTAMTFGYWFSRIKVRAIIIA